MLIVELDHIRPDVNVQIGGKVHDLRIQSAVAVEQGSPDFRFPVFVKYQAVALADQQLGCIGSEGSSFFFSGQHFQPVLDGKNGQQILRRLGIGFRMPQKVLQQWFQRNMYRRDHGILKGIFRRILIGDQEDHVGDDHVGRGQINIFRNFFLLQQLRQFAFLDDDRRQGRPEDPHIHSFFQQPAALGRGAVLEYQQGDSLAPALCMPGQGPQFFLGAEFA